MTRPRSSSKKATKQKGGAAVGKRKQSGAPPGGGAAGRPAKQRRGEAKPKVEDKDIFEAEDSDPDEVKHAGRYDEVENYEYELPSDFEDEEIDEDNAFTEEDKKKFGSWFEREVSADEDGDGTIGVGDADDDWADDEGEEGDSEEDEGAAADDGKHPGKRRKGGQQGQRSAKPHVASDEDEGEEDDLDGLFPDDDDAGEEDEGEDGGEDDERHRAMLRDALKAVGSDGAGRRKRRDPNAAVVSEAYPESEFSLNPGAASAGASSGLSLADLLAGLTPEEAKKLGAAKRLLERVGGRKSGGGREREAMAPVAVPLPSVVAERQERKAGYEAAKEEVTRWQPIVKANREAPTLRLVSAREEVPRVTTTAALVAQHVPAADNALEAEVAALLEAAGAAGLGAQAEAEEELALKALSLEEARERRERLAKMRSLLHYHELKARRLKAIKSKEYHRHLARASKRKAAKMAAAAAEAGAGGSVDAERAAAIEAEYQRAKERLTLRHRNSSRWARRALKRGQLQVDEGTKAALAEQLQLGQQLRRRIEGRKGSGSDEDDSDSDASTSASDGEGGQDEGADAGGAEGGEAAAGSGLQGLAGRSGGRRLRSAALEVLEGGGPLDGESAPAKGLLALPFMQRAMERRRQAAREEAETLLRELEEGAALGSDGEDGGMGAAALLGGAAMDIELRSAEAAAVGYSAPSGGGSMTGVSGRRRFGGGAAVAAEASDGEESDSDAESDDLEDAEAKAERLGRPGGGVSRAEQRREQAAQQAAAARARAEARPRPTEAAQAELDAVLAAGAAGKGMLVSSADAGVDMGVAPPASVGRAARAAAEDEGAERRESGRSASTRAGAGGVLSDILAHQGATAGGRAGLFEAGKPAAVAAAPVAAAAGPAQPNFIPSKAFVGAKAGYQFTKGPRGVGYYLDTAAAAAGGGKGSGAQGQQGGGAKGKGAGKQQQQDGVASAPITMAGQPIQEGGGGKKGSQPASASAKTAKGHAKDSAAAAAGEPDSGSDDEDGGGGMQPASQRDLIRAAFAGDDVEAEFAAEKAAAVAEELPTIEEPSKLPGWGAWSAQQRSPRWMQVAKERAAKQRTDAAAGRKDAATKYVVISERWDKKAQKYTAPAAPFPFSSQDAYERSLRQPLGRDFNPDAAFRDLTRPAVLKQSGAVIAPLRFSEAAATALREEKGAKGREKREARRVMTVGGGMVRTGKR